MTAIFFILWIVSVPAFIFYWWKKRKARLAAGEDYQNDANYQSASKIKRIVGIMSVAALVLFLGNLPSASDKEAQPQTVKQETEAEKADRLAKEVQKELDDMEAEIKTGWNTETTDTDKNRDNWEKATDLVKKYPDYIHGAMYNWINAEDALKKPWDYYGQVVSLRGTIYSIEQLPPGNSVAKFFGGNCYRAMLRIGDSLDAVAVSMYIVGDASNIQENSIVNVKGYIYGHSKLKNRMGGSSKGLAFVGFRDEVSE